MATDSLQDQILRLIQSSSTLSTERLRAQLDQLTGVTVQQLASVRENTDAVSQNTVAQSSSRSRLEPARTAASVLGSGLFLSPLVSGLARLFGGREQSPSPTLPAFSRPEPLSISAAIGVQADRPFVPLDASQDGTPRRVETTQNFNISIQALDSQSILDRSEDIALAVRRALLTSHSLGSVISEI